MPLGSGTASSLAPEIEIPYGPMAGLDWSTQNLTPSQLPVNPVTKTSTSPVKLAISESSFNRS